MNLIIHKNYVRLNFCMRKLSQINLVDTKSIRNGIFYRNVSQINIFYTKFVTKETGLCKKCITDAFVSTKKYIKAGICL